MRTLNFLPALALSLLGSTAFAAPLIQVGACLSPPCVVAEANLSPALIPGFPNISFGPSTIGNFSVLGTASVSPGENFISQAIAVSTTTGGVLDLFFSGTGAQGQGPVLLTSSFTSNQQNATTHTVTENTWLDTGNTLFGKADSLSTATFSSPGIDTATDTVFRDTTTGPVQLGEEYVVTLLDGCSVANPCNANLTIEIAAASVPEPSPLVLLVTGFMLLGVYGLFRNRAALFPHDRAI